MEKPDFKDRVVLRTPYIGGEPIPGVFLETLYQPEDKKTLFAVWRGDKVEFQKEFAIGNNQALLPYSAENNLIKNGIILFPSGADDYGSKPELLAEDTDFVHRYVSINRGVEAIAAHYVLLTMVAE